MLRDRFPHRAWSILLLCFAGVLAAQGARLSFGAFIEPWEREYSAGRGTITAVSLLSFVVYGAVQPVVGHLVDRLGVRRVLPAGLLIAALGMALASRAGSVTGLALTYGVLASVGFGTASGVAASVAATRWFARHRGLAFGLIEAGFGAGQLAFAPGALLAIDAAGWRPTMLVMAGVLALVVAPPLALLLRDAPEDVGLRPLGADPAAVPGSEPDDGVVPELLPAAPLLRSRAFWGLAVPFFVCGITTTGLIDTHFIPYLRDQGLSTATTSAAVAILAFANFAGILTSGPIADRADNRKVLGLLYGLRGLSLVLLVVAGAPREIILFAIVFGLVDFSVVAPTQVLASGFFGGRSLGVVFGLLMLSHQLGSGLGAWVPGLVFDATGSYDLVFAVAIAGLALAAALSFGLPRPWSTRPPRTLAHPEMA